MQKIIQVRILPQEADSSSSIILEAARVLNVPAVDIYGFNIIKRSIDARGRQPWITLTIQIFVGEPFHKRERTTVAFKDVTHAIKTAIIIGAGPAGLFAALKLLEQGIRPVILERGKDVRARRRDLAVLNKEGVINPESNYCFGEGGAGTYSDGKLYTRSSKRGDVSRILNLLVQFGANENILYDAHPHIGTNKLPEIITAIRKTIEGFGGLILFNSKVVDFVLRGDSVKAVLTSDGQVYQGDAFILATGHSARDIFELLASKKITIETKSFALGVRIEHPQQLIDSIQYHCDRREEHLPPASYTLVEQVQQKGVFSFCMCPGGIIAPAATAPGELVVNGWSPSKRNNPFANSGIVVAVDEKDLAGYTRFGPLAGMNFQQAVEQKAFLAGGGHLVAPAQRMVDFVNQKVSTNLPACSYLPGVHSSELKDVLPGFVHSGLQKAFRLFGKKMNGYFTNEAIVVATESRTSSPVRIPRLAESLQHPQIKNLYPCGEGAGYAGGIVSAAMDGERVAAQIVTLA